MDRTKRPLGKLMTRQQSVPNSTSSAPTPTPEPASIPEAPQPQTPLSIVNGHANVPDVPPPSPHSPVPPSPAAATSPAVPKTNGTDVQELSKTLISPPPLPPKTGGADVRNLSETPKAPPAKTERDLSPAKDSANGVVDGLSVNDTASVTSSKRKRSPSLDLAPISTRGKRLRALPEGPIKLNEDEFHPPYTPLTPLETQEWKGWVEVESEPIYVNTMLRELGVEAVRAEEILDLGHSVLELEPPVYGLIFLFQYQDSDHVAKGGTCPPHVWFANQLPATNACATIALINILMNTENVELGRPFTYFKEDTMDLTPMERAHCINEHEFIRGVHNSFASRVDMWLADRIFATKYKNQVQAREKRLRDEQREREKAQKAAKAHKQASKQPPKPPPSTRPKRKTAAVAASKKKKNMNNYCDDTDSDDDHDHEDEQPSTPDQNYDDESAFHYAAYVPIAGHIWRLDGMSAHPQDLGPYTHVDSWLCDAAPHIQARMAEFEHAGSGVLFNLMALVKDPAARARESLAANVKTLRAVEARLDGLSKEWKGFAEELGEDVLRGVDEEMGLTSAILAAAPDPEDIPESSVEKLLQKRVETARDQESLKELIRIQKVRVTNEQLKVEKDRLDLNPMIQRVLLDLEEIGEVQGLMDECREW